MVLQTPASPARRLRGAYTWEIAPLHLRPGDRVSYHLEAKDNDGIDGPQRPPGAHGFGNTGRAVMGQSLHDVRWDVLGPSPFPAHMHMALDEVLLDRMIAGARGPAIRFWEWT